jgi:chemosensory pili system protein ChpC
MQQLNKDDTTNDVLPCLLIPVHGSRLVLPNVTVAELIPFQSLEETPDTESWLLGRTEWRGTNIPVISYESFSGQKLGTNSEDLRIAVVNAPNGESGTLRFFGILAQGIPSLVKLEASAIKEKPNMDLKPGQKMEVTLETGYGVIPDLDTIESAVLEQAWQ